MFDPRLQGHMAIREKLLARLQAGKLPGTLLFTGPEGIGKRRVALELAQRELCFRRTACGECEGCALFSADPLPVELPNLLRIAPEGKAGLIKVGMIREDDLVEGGVIAWASLSPAPGCHRWILIEDAHRLNGASANILLKTLEEPPPGTRFLLITHRPEAVLQTIRSRAQRIAFAPLAPKEAWAVASAKGWHEGSKQRWMALSEGTLRYLEEEAFQRAQAQLEAWMLLLEGGAFASAAEPLLPEKDADKAQNEQLREALEVLLRALADLARLRAGKEAALTPWAERLRKLAARTLDLKGPQDLIHEALRNLARNPSPEPLLREVALSLA